MDKERISINLIGSEEDLADRVGSEGIINKITSDKDCWHITATFQAESSICPICNNPLSPHGWVIANYLDVPFFKVPVLLHARRPRYICRQCAKTFTPIVHGLREKPRVTKRLARYIQENLWHSNSLRAFAISVGAQPQTVAQLLNAIADEARTQIVMPKRLGIHELHIGHYTHLLLSNLETGTAVEFIPDANNQLAMLKAYLGTSNAHHPIELIMIPADIEIGMVVTGLPLKPKLVFSISCIDEVASKVIVNQASAFSRRGRVGSISSSDALRICQSQLANLSSEDAEARIKGLCEGSLFWKLYDAKENLISEIKENNAEDWVPCLMNWLNLIDRETRSGLIEFTNQLLGLKSIGATPTSDTLSLSVEVSVQKIKNFFLKPGSSFSPEMIAALVLAVPILQIPVPKKFGHKGAGPFWLEESQDIHSGNFSSYGTTLHSLSEILTLIPR